MHYLLDISAAKNFKILLGRLFNNDVSLLCVANVEILIQKYYFFLFISQCLNCFCILFIFVQTLQTNIRYSRSKMTDL